MLIDAVYSGDEVAAGRVTEIKTAESAGIECGRSVMKVSVVYDVMMVTGRIFQRHILDG